LDSLKEQHADPVDIEISFSLVDFYRSQFDEGLQKFDHALQKVPYPTGREYLAWFYFLAGREEEARRILEALEPDLFGTSDITITPSDWQTVIAAAGTLVNAGEQARATYLIDSVLELIESDEASDYDYVKSFQIITANVIRGDKDTAVTTLRKVFDSGWRDGWWVLRAPLFESMRGDPRWVAITDELAADIAMQRAWFEEHKNDELFQSRQ
jgi:hypothetical protein